MVTDEMVEAAWVALVGDKMAASAKVATVDQNDMRAALTALETTLGIDITAIAEGRAVVVPVEPDDGRPNGWTEARALEFIARGGTDEQDFAELFVEGSWPEIDRHYPQFRAMLAARSAPHDQ